MNKNLPSLTLLLALLSFNISANDQRRVREQITKPKPHHKPQQPRAHRGHRTPNQPQHPSSVRRIRRGPPHISNQQPVNPLQQLRGRTQRRYIPKIQYYGTKKYHRPAGYQNQPYQSYSHRAILTGTMFKKRFTPKKYLTTLQAQFQSFIYINWVLYPSHLQNGYRSVNHYPFFIHNGYRHRYSAQDTCNYQLIDKNTHEVVNTYWNQYCNTGYNQCAQKRDSFNQSLWENRYLCAETIKGRNFNFKMPTYVYEDQRSGQFETCFNYDRESGQCFDR